jgi:hypothetical protein
MPISGLPSANHRQPNVERWTPFNLDGRKLLMSKGFHGTLQGARPYPASSFKMRTAQLRNELRVPPPKLGRPASDNTHPTELEGGVTKPRTSLQYNKSRSPYNRVHILPQRLPQFLIRLSKIPPSEIRIEIASPSYT